MEDLKFSTATDLYKRLLPALKSKKNELKSKGLFYITEIDIWNYLVANKWKLRNDLRLNEVVNDIFKIDEIKLIEHFKFHNRNYEKLIDRNEENEK